MVVPDPEEFPDPDSIGLKPLETPEFDTVVVSDAVRRDETLKQAPGYTDWAVRHQDVVL